MATDFSELDGLFVDLKSAAPAARPLIRKVFQESAEDIRDEARKTAARTGLESYAASIGYTTREKGAAIEAEVGPTPGRRQGSFGFVEEGGGGVRSAPQHALRDALKHAEPEFFERLEDALGDAVDKAVGG